MKILITGGAGSLGKEFVKQFRKDHDVIAIDNNEWAVASNPGTILCDYDEFNYEAYPLDLVVHTAAYKHVDLGENNPDAFIDNNIVKTLKLFKRLQSQATPFIFISTDKAVRPVNLYGFTKAIGEKLALFYGGHIARLGNLIGSNGSVIPLWEEQLKNNEPLTITNLDMERYLIDIDEAVRQVIFQYEQGERIIIPKMEKVKLVHLVETVLRQHNKPIDYPINIIGLRPGEKMVEEMEW